MTKRDQIISFILPAMIVLFGYFWFIRRPFQKEFVQQKETYERFNGMDEEGFRMQNRTLSRNLEEARKTKEKVLAQIDLDRKKLEGAPVSDLSDEARLRQMISLVDMFSLRLLSAKREEQAVRFSASFIPDLSGRSCWTFHLQGGYPQVQKLLQKNREKGLSIPFSLNMNPSIEPGKATDWILQFFL